MRSRQVSVLLGNEITWEEIALDHRPRVPKPAEVRACAQGPEHETSSRRIQLKRTSPQDPASAEYVDHSDKTKTKRQKKRQPESMNAEMAPPRRSVVGGGNCAHSRWMMKQHLRNSLLHVPKEQYHVAESRGASKIQ